MLLLVTYTYIHVYIHIYTHTHTHTQCFSLVHHTALMATGETSHLTTYMTNIQAVFKIIQFNHNYVYKKG
jgi:hypothetical protein